MISLNIQRIATLRNIPNIYTYLLHNGFSSNIAHRLVNSSDSNVKFQYLEKLCLLFHCTPNDLLQWQPNANLSIQENEPLKVLNHPQTTGIENLLKTATIEELTQLHQKLNNKQEL